MAASPLRSKALHHGRSLSLPFKPHPATSQFYQNLSTVRGSEALSSSLSSMNNSVHGLKNLYTNINDLLQLPRIQQITSQECQGKWVEQVLDGYIRLLDACTTAKDLVSHTKYEVQQLFSALRRKDVNDIHCCMTSRRKSKKNIQKSLKDLRISKGKQNAVSSNKDEDTMAIVDMSREAESVTIAMLESLLSCVMGTKVQSGWSFVSKLMHTKKVLCQTDLTEFQKMDAFLQMSLDAIQAEELMAHLKDMESSIQNLEEELECLFRQLIKTRVFLLNILNH